VSRAATGRNQGRIAQAFLRREGAGSDRIRGESGRGGKRRFSAVPRSMSPVTVMMVRPWSCPLGKTSMGVSALSWKRTKARRREAWTRPDRRRVGASGSSRPRVVRRDFTAPGARASRTTAAVARLKAPVLVEHSVSGDPEGLLSRLPVHCDCSRPCLSGWVEGRPSGHRSTARHSKGFDAIPRAAGSALECCEALPYPRTLADCPTPRGTDFTGSWRTIRCDRTRAAAPSSSPAMTSLG
jgi:hypothetical protein